MPDDIKITSDPPVRVQPVVSTREHDFFVAHQRYKAAERSTERVETKAGAMALAVTLNRMLKAAELLAEEIGERANDQAHPTAAEREVERKKDSQI